MHNNEQEKIITNDNTEMKKEKSPKQLLNESINKHSRECKELKSSLEKSKDSSKFLKEVEQLEKILQPNLNAMIQDQQNTASQVYVIELIVNDKSDFIKNVLKEYRASKSIKHFENREQVLEFLNRAKSKAQRLTDTSQTDQKLQTLKSEALSLLTQKIELEELSNETAITLFESLVKMNLKQFISQQNKKKITTKKSQKEQA
ncbi:hypothetical protein PVK64_14815 [Aliivibrio sp. S4TY2]|uniref:Uncharacterized protein n=1 Tax=Aliivibrio finisterrensis TaxID=511998 RepID=A0A4Q5KKM0_9GAMM|nr:MULTISPECIES: hypothetical protein [Aliivibrio]MDD9157443.1 hypothetical protein [Aliivibrio sp. S4TY2]MDD9161363.1 hypothetical protein [Aliivibrio sp. S4TY1]MDD9165393.1 hypothetical protein [Aliivibrio sp. S4MY2]MDD9169352.1 hypothetical protein [Aliivibrio sp. S4MY4]MDD9179232.1 hypothetical protein [Aliivibrio sp. A6]